MNISLTCRRCCFIHTRVDENGMRYDGTQVSLVSASVPISATKGLSLRSPSEIIPLSNATLHSPRARTISQGFEGIHDKESGITESSSIEAGSEISASTIATSSNNLFFYPLHERTGSADSIFDNTLQSSTDPSEGPHRLITSKASWNSSSSFPVTPSREAREHPWSASPSTPTIPAPVISGLGVAFGKLSVATDFSSDFKTQHIGSFSAIPFQDKAAVYPPAAPIDEASGVFFGSYSAHPESSNGKLGFFSEAVANMKYANSMSESYGSYSRRDFISESLPTRQVFLDSFSTSLKTSNLNLTGPSIGSPLATSFEDPFLFASEPTSPGFRPLNRRSRGALRDVWSSATSNTPSTSPLLSGSLPPQLDKGVTLSVFDGAPVSPPSSPVSLP